MTRRLLRGLSGLNEESSMSGLNQIGCGTAGCEGGEERVRSENVAGDGGRELRREIVSLIQLTFFSFSPTPPSLRGSLPSLVPHLLSEHFIFFIIPARVM